MVNALTSPTSFYIPVTGQYADGKVTIAMGEARADFNEAYTVAHTFYVVIAPTTMMFPVMGHFSLPYTNAPVHPQPRREGRLHRRDREASRW